MSRLGGPWTEWALLPPAEHQQGPQELASIAAPAQVVVDDLVDDILLEPAGARCAPTAEGVQLSSIRWEILDSLQRFFKEIFERCLTFIAESAGLSRSENGKLTRISLRNIRRTHK